MVRRRCPDRGMTLVELMVTMIISSIVAASTFMFFAGQQRIYETQTRMLNVQQNVWAGMEVLTRFVRAAGGGMFGCVRPVGRTAGLVTDDSDAAPVMVDGSLRPVHTVAFTSVPAAGLRAYRDGGLQRIPPLWIVDQVDGTLTANRGIVPGTDVITVAFGNRTSGTDFDSYLAAAVTSAAGPGTTVAGTIVQTLPGNSNMFRAGEFMLLMGEPGMGGIANDRGCTLLQITRVTTGTDLLEHANGTSICTPNTTCTGSPWNPGATAPTGLIPLGATYGVPDPLPPSEVTTNANTGVRNFGDFWWVQFAIRTTDSKGIPLNNTGVPSLTMWRIDQGGEPEVLAEGIEDLQVAYACDYLPKAGPGGTPPAGDGRLPDSGDGADEWMLNSDADVISTASDEKCNQPTAVRITLVARSLTEDNAIDTTLLDNGRPAAENHAAHTADERDGYRRRVLTTTVFPRNSKDM